ncbi:uncharacterized protein [Setaria viridis]|uniref:uncharacterized protein n=1 Tax=Setaria viridis TaxID=4556 RepID=UPI003B3B6403
MADDDDAARAEKARRAEEERLRSVALDEYEAAHVAIWVQATAVVNVKALIPVILDQATNTYTKWRGMFLTVLGKYALTRHVLEDEAFPTRPAWVQADCVVLTWIHGTVSGDLQQSLMMRQRPAREAWCYLEDEFLGQRESRALLLETQFRNFRQDSLTITDYCRRLESMAASLAEFGDPIGDRQLVLTLLRGLSGKFRHMVSILKMHRPFPTFAEARTHLLLEEMEIDARPPSPPAALVAAPRPAANIGGPAAPRYGAPTPPTRPHGMHPSFAHPWAGTLQMWPYGHPPPAPPAFTAVPQYGYGSSFSGVPSGGAYGSGYTAPPSPYVYGGAAPAFQGPSPAYQVSQPAPWNPVHGGAWTQDSLAQSFNTMTLTPPAPSEWYADSGAGSHMTADAGFANQERDRQVQ